jgi:hypothetical protein
VLGWTTIAGNTAHNKGGALCVSSTRLEVNSVILADNGEVPLCYLESDFGEMEASIAWSDLWPQSQWIVEEASDGESLNLDELGLVGDGMLNEDPKFEDLGAFDLHLEEGSLCINAGDPEFDDPDGTPSDMGMYGFVDWEEGDDDDSGPDDDDDVGPDDDDVMDDDDGDDDDSADIAELLPSGFRCDCSTVAGGSRAGWVLLLPLLALLRRR